MLNYEGVWEEFSDRLRRFILWRVQNEHDAEDILQDVFYKIHKNVDNLKDWDKLESWIYQITRNTIVDYYRLRSKAIVGTLEIPGDVGEATITEDTSKNIAECIKPMIDDLPEKYKQAIILTEYEELTQKEMAEKLGLSLSGAKSRVQRARGSLKEMLLVCCHFEFDRFGHAIDYQPKEKTCRYCSRGRAGV